MTCFCIRPDRNCEKCRGGEKFIWQLTPHETWEAFLSVRQALVNYRGFVDIDEDYERLCKIDNLLLDIRDLLEHIK